MTKTAKDSAPLGGAYTRVCAALKSYLVGFPEQYAREVFAKVAKSSHAWWVFGPIRTRARGLGTGSRENRSNILPSTRARDGASWAELPIDFGKKYQRSRWVVTVVDAPTVGARQLPIAEHWISADYGNEGASNLGRRLSGSGQATGRLWVQSEFGRSATE